MGRGTFELEGSEYWDLPVKTTARVVHAFAVEGRQGLFLDAPAQADLDHVDRVPLLVLSATATKDTRRYDPWRAGHLVCTRLEDRSVEVIDLFERPEDGDPFADDPPGPEPEGDGGSVVTDQTDALRLGLLARSGTYVLTALVGDRVSNQVEILISGSAPDTPGSAPEPVRYALGQSPDGSDGSNPAPIVSGPQGIAIECEPIGLGPTAWLRGTVCVPALACEIVPAPPVAGDDGFGQPRPAAIVRVGLVVLSGRDGEATTIPLQVPCVRAQPVVPGELITAAFAIDLAQHSTLVGRPHRSFVYAWCGDAMAGPLRVDETEE